MAHYKRGKPGGHYLNAWPKWWDFLFHTRPRRKHSRRHRHKRLVHRHAHTRTCTTGTRTNTRPERLGLPRVSQGRAEAEPGLAGFFTWVGGGKSGWEKELRVSGF